jgi:hypothetical protein
VSEPQRSMIDKMLQRKCSSMTSISRYHALCSSLDLVIWHVLQTQWFGQTTAVWSRMPKDNWVEIQILLIQT